MKVPLHNIGDEPETEIEEGEEKPIEKKKLETPIPLGEFTFKRLSFVVENTSLNQAVEVKLGSFEVLHDNAYTNTLSLYSYLFY